MIITTVKKNATNGIGTRVVAVSDGGHREVELWDFNATDDENHKRAAQRIASRLTEVVDISTLPNARIFEAR